MRNHLSLPVPPRKASNYIAAWMSDLTGIVQTKDTYEAEKRVNANHHVDGILVYFVDLKYHCKKVIL